MKQWKKFTRKSSLILTAALILSGCGTGWQPPASVEGQEDVSDLPTAAAAADRTVEFDFQVNPEDFSLTAQVGADIVLVSGASPVREVSGLQRDGNDICWTYPKEQVSVSVRKEKDYLDVEIVSNAEEDHAFVWPYVTGEDYYIPFGEGKRVPAGDSAWQNYLSGESFSVMEQLSMPFWASATGDYAVLFIMENPFRTQFNFAADQGVRFSVSHEYPAIDKDKTKRFRIYITENDPVNAAKIYLDYVREKGDFVTLEQKAEANPNVRKLYGAPFIYLWGEFILSSEDIHWPEFRKALSSGIMDYLLAFADKQENGKEFATVIGEITRQDYVAEYQKNVVCNYISQLLKREDFWNPSIFTERTSKLTNLLEKGYENLSESEKIQVNKYALAASLPQVFADADQWMGDSTVGLIDEMKAGGIEQAWIGLNSWEQAYAKPELVEKAVDQGYLIGSYDSYHSIHEPGKERWITASFRDPSLYEEAAVTDKDGKKIGGFQNVGHKLNPVLAFPSVKDRMEDIMSNQLPFNSWFIDCDATGEIYDDYSPGHVTTQQEDLKARLERMAYIRDQYGLVIGSEGGNDFAASTIAFAHGIELKSFSWMDDDMKKNKDSEYYIGNYYSPYGGVAEHFSRTIPVKEAYYTVFADPRYDIPLFKLVYNDSVITSYHWDWSTFKIQGAAQERMLREVLYNVPPLYHLDAVEWEKQKEDILRHQGVWGDFSKKAVTMEMTDFKYLTEDGSVQKTVFGGDITVIANFGDSVFQCETVEIPACSVLIVEDGEQVIYSPS